MKFLGQASDSFATDPLPWASKLVNDLVHSGLIQQPLHYHLITFVIEATRLITEVHMGGCWNGHGLFALRCLGLVVRNGVGPGNRTTARSTAFWSSRPLGYTYIGTYIYTYTYCRGLKIFPMLYGFPNSLPVNYSALGSRAIQLQAS